MASDSYRHSFPIYLKVSLLSFTVDLSFHLLSNDTITTPTLRIGFAEYIEELLSADTFVRCHESIAVNIAAIDKLVKYEIELRNKEIIPVSRNRYAEIASAYMDYRL